MAKRQEVPTSGAERVRVFDARSVLEVLMSRAEGTLSAAELQWLASGAPDHAIYLAGNAAQVMEGIGCLVRVDGEPEGPRFGCFQSAHDVPDLAFHVSALLRQIEGLMLLGNRAADLAERRPR